jgi:transposase-like protein
MKKVAKKTVVREAQDDVAQLGLAGAVRRGLRELVFDAGMARLHQVLEEERTAVCGPRYAQLPERQARRMGHAPGELVLGGRLVQVSRPRARTLDGREVVLPSWQDFRTRDPLSERAVEQMVLGVATRKYDRSLEPVAPGLRTRGTSKSAVSRRFVSATEASVSKWLDRDLSHIDMLVLMIDGLHVADHVILVAMAIDTDGNKHVLGLREGATENSTSCKALLADLQSRGLRTDKAVLAVIDGSKALAKAIKNIFGECAVIQRCQEHKIRNVEEHLPETMRPSVRHTMREAYRCRNVTRARRLLGNLARRLRDDHPGAAASLNEGLDETLTVMAFGLPEWLERTLSTTNAIENLVGAVRDLGARVKRWRNGRMIVRWTATALIEAQGHFHRVRDHRGLKVLAAALNKKLQQGLAPVAQPA